MRSSDPHLNGAGAPARVVIAGGGFAALETMLALRAFAPDRVQIELVALSDRLAYRPAATAEPFSEGPPRAYDLAAIAADLGAAYRRDSVEAVAPSAHRVRLGSGAELAYDWLVLALGARPHASVSGALTFRDQRDVGLVRRVLDEARAGIVERIVFAVPSGISWPVPAYELALLTAASIGVGAEIALVTPERSPLELLGPDSSRLVRDLLAERDVRFIGRSSPSRFDRAGGLWLHFNGRMPADRVVAVPELRGPPIGGIPRDWNGFVPTDRAGRIPGLDGVYAIGDMAAHPIKHGGIAAQQADRAAADLAVRLGASVEQPPMTDTVHVRLLGGPQPLDLHSPSHDTEIRPEDGSAQTKVFGRYLTSYLADRPALAATACSRRRGA